MLSRATFIPAFASFSINSDVELEGPSVQMILVSLKSRRWAMVGQSRNLTGSLYNVRNSLQACVLPRARARVNTPDPVFQGSLPQLCRRSNRNLSAT